MVSPAPCNPQFLTDASISERVERRQAMRNVILCHLRLAIRRRKEVDKNAHVLCIIFGCSFIEFL